MTNIPDKITLRDLVEAAAFDLEQILKCVRSNGTPSMKYALESLPALLGRQQLLQLLLVLGLDGEYVAIEKDRSVDPGEWLAAAIAHRAVRADRLRREEDRRLSEDFERMLQRASAAPCELSPEAEPQPSPQALSADSPLQ